MIPKSATYLLQPITLKTKVYEDGPISDGHRRRFLGKRQHTAIAFTAKRVYFTDGSYASQVCCEYNDHLLAENELYSIYCSQCNTAQVQTTNEQLQRKYATVAKATHDFVANLSNTRSETNEQLRRKYADGFGTNAEQVAAQTMTADDFADWLESNDNDL